MRIIISPTKKMNRDNDILPFNGMPIFMEESNFLLDYLKGLSYEELKSIWKCSYKIAMENYENLKHTNLNKNLSPAIFSYEGIQFQYISPKVLSYDELDYIEERLRIISGLYGIVKPFDGVVTYRLEMLSKFKDFDYSNLYDFWGDKIAKNLFAESNIIINLASKEYSKVISKFLNPNIIFINCVFGEIINGNVKEKATYAKMARGEMVRFMAKNSIDSIDGLKDFNSLGYYYSESFSDEMNFVFIKK